MSFRRTLFDLSKWEKGKNDLDALLTEAERKELLKYWETNSGKWAKSLRLLELGTAYDCGDFDSLLYGTQIQGGSENLLGMSVQKKDASENYRAILELFKKGELQVRRIYRNLTVEEVAPLWEQVMAARSHLIASECYEEVVRETERARNQEYEKAREDLASAYDERGQRLAFAELLTDAGATPEERLLTETLLCALVRDSATKRTDEATFRKQDFSAGVQEVNGRRLLVLKFPRWIVGGLAVA